jgi:predicted cupin superfamily sugar epimerase/mannose-6-phosphate isomerase-like protein (cupin superfamily)
MAGKLIAHYHMQRIPQEGPWFTLTYQSDDSLDGSALPTRYAGRPHAAGSAIIALETAADFSALHRLQTDEVWHFYGGSPIELLLLYPDGHGQKVVLGANVLAGELPQFTVPRGVWQGSAPRGTSPQRYALFGDQLSPAFLYEDFEMGYRDALQKEYPSFAQDIERLTRAEFASKPAAVSQAPATPASGVVFSAADIPVQSMAAGVDLRELVGKVAKNARTDRVSIAQFTLAPGHSSGSSYNHVSQEVFLVTGGSGKVHLNARVESVGPGSTVFIPAQETHSIEADPNNTLTFLAISAPSFTPEDYVAVKP